jgi:hypothetical protein
MRFRFLVRTGQAARNTYAKRLREAGLKVVPRKEHVEVDCEAIRWEDAKVFIQRFGAIASDQFEGVEAA